jgi:hypothetical protein
VFIWHFVASNCAVDAFFMFSPWQFTGLDILPIDVISRTPVHTSLILSFSPHNVTFLEVRGSKVQRLLKNMKS